MAKDTVSLDFLEKKNKGEQCDLEMELLHEIMSYSVALIFFHVSLQSHCNRGGVSSNGCSGGPERTDTH